MSNVAEIENEILGKIKARAGGNDTRGLKEVASDLVNSLGMKDSDIAYLSGLSDTTIRRLRSLSLTEKGEEYRPQAHTLEMIFRACGAEISLTPVKLKKKFRIQPVEKH